MGCWGGRVWLGDFVGWGGLWGEGFMCLGAKGGRGEGYFMCVCVCVA